MIKDKKNILLIAISSYTSGDAQSTRVDDIAISVRDEFDVMVITSFADGRRAAQDFPRVIVIKNYYLAFLSPRVKKLFKSARLVVVETGLPYAFCSFFYKSRFIWILYGPDKGIRFSGSYIVKNKLNLFLERDFLLSSAKLLITPAEWVSNFYRRKGMNVISIPAAINCNIFYPNKVKRIDRNNVRLIIVGSWDGFNGRKRQHELLNIFPAIVKSFPNIHLTAAGLDNSSIRILAQMVDSLNLSNNVELIGRLNPTEVAEAMTAADIYVSNTISDAFYRIIVEAFSCGLPAIARDASKLIPDFHLAPKHHVINSGAGALYDGTSKSFLRALNEVLANYEELKENALRYASRFSRELVLNEYRDIILSLAQNVTSVSSHNYDKGVGNLDEER